MAKFIRKISFLVILILIANVFVVNTEAKQLNDSFVLVADVTETDEVVDDASCDTVLGDLEDPHSIAYLLQEIFKIMKFATPVLVLIFSIIDFIKSISTQDKEILQKAIKRTIIRVIVGLVVFVIPSICNFIFDLLGWYGTCGIK